MARNQSNNLELTCPCCGAKLTVDAELGKVVAHEAPPKVINAPDFDRAADILAREKARRESVFNQSAEDQKTRSELLDRMFQESAKKSKDEPVTRPMRDIDLD